MTWRRSDLTSMGLGHALIHPLPHYALGHWPASGFVLTGPDSSSRVELDLDTVRALLAESGTEEPTADDLDWLTGRDVDDLPWSDP